MKNANVHQMQNFVDTDQIAAKMRWYFNSINDDYLLSWFLKFIFVAAVCR